MVDITKLTEEEIDELAREGKNTYQRAYQREYYRKNKKHLRDLQKRYWAKKALEAREQESTSPKVH